MTHKRPKCDTYAEVEFARLVNAYPDAGYVVTRLPGHSSGVWIVGIGGRTGFVAGTISEAVEGAIQQVHSGVSPGEEHRITPDGG
jgi:hypothetical protein